MSLKESSRKTYFILQLFCAVAGVLLSLYLLVHHTRVKSGIQDHASFCSFGKFADCDVVNVSPYSEVIGVPVASIGALFYFVLLLLGLLAPPRESNFPLFQRVMAWLTAAGLGINLYLFVFVQWMTLRTFCLVCFLTYVASFFHLFFNFKMSEKSNDRHWIHGLFLGGNDWKIKKLAWTRVVPFLISLVCFTAALVFLPGYIRLRESRYAGADQAVDQFYATWSDKARKDIAVADGDGTYGDPNSKVKIVEFSDFQCPFCKKAAFTVHNVLKPFEKKVYFVFKHYPLDSTCNSQLTYQMHPFACRLARLAYCAQKKNQFWEFHDFAFMQLSEEDLKEGFDSVKLKLKSIFTPEEIDACLADPKSLENVTASIQLGNSLAVRGTPTTYINGKQITIPVTVESLSKLIQIEDSLEGPHGQQ